MKYFLIPLLTLLTTSCSEKSHGDMDDITTELNADGDTLIIKRKGHQIATFRNTSNVCYIDLTGTDMIPDVRTRYYEDDDSELSPGPQDILLAWPQEDGHLKIIAYDSKGNLVRPEADSDLNDQRVQQGGADQAATAPESKSEGIVKPKPESKPAPR